MSTPQHPEALRLADELEAEFAQWSISNHTGRKAATELLRQHARIAELEAQLESIGAGGVSGPLMGCASIAASAGSEPVASYAIRMLVAAGHITQAKADESLRLAAEFTHPSPPEGMVAEQALRKVLSVVQRYLPPDGPTAYDAMTEIIAIVDPWPLGQLEKP